MWRMVQYGGGSVRVWRAAGGPAPSACVAVPAGCQPSNCYPLRLARCTSANQTLWTHDADSSELQLAAGASGTALDAPFRSAPASICMDASSKDSVGTYACGSGAGTSSRQPNQRWSLDEDSGREDNGGEEENEAKKMRRMEYERELME